jgi:hypothetical protein
VFFARRASRVATSLRRKLFDSVRVMFEGEGRRRLTVDAPMPFRLDLSGITGAPARTRLCRAGVVRERMETGKATLYRPRPQ